MLRNPWTASHWPRQRASCLAWAWMPAALEVGYEDDWNSVISSTCGYYQTNLKTFLCHVRKMVTVFLFDEFDEEVSDELVKDVGNLHRKAKRKQRSIVAIVETDEWYLRWWRMIMIQKMNTMLAIFCFPFRSTQRSMIDTKADIIIDELSYVSRLTVDQNENLCDDVFYKRIGKFMRFWNQWRC